MTEGRIDKALSGFYYVATTAGETLTCRARGKFRKEGLSPLVGDRVAVRELGNGEGYVEEILPRRNAFQRPAVANIDQLGSVASGAIPVTDPFLIDRMSAVAALKDCGVVLLLNKHDLDPAEELYRIYTAAGFPTLRVSAETGEGMAELEDLLAGKLSAFTGNSGVGKSSILNRLDPTCRRPFWSSGPTSASAASWAAATPRRKAAPCWRPSAVGRSRRAGIRAISGSMRN